MSIFLSISFFILGLVIGSFLNCVIYRLKAKKSLKGRSFCPKCKHKLEFLDLIPVLSFIVQKGKCRHCGEKIDPQYILVEVISGLLFLAIVLKFLIPYPFSFTTVLNTLFLLIVSSFLIIIFFYDLKYLIIPDKIIYPAISLTAGYWLLTVILKAVGVEFNSLFPNPYSLAPIFTALGTGGFFYLLAALSNGKWMGGGDIKLAFLIGLVIGWPSVLVALSFAFVLGSLVGIILLLSHQKKIKDEIPFGPFLITGLFFALFFGDVIINLYSSTLILM